MAMKQFWAPVGTGRVLDWDHEKVFTFEVEGDLTMEDGNARLLAG